jgi:hypothetical protein
LVTVKKPHLPCPAGHGPAALFTGLQFEEHTCTFGIGVLPLVTWMTHWPRGCPQSLEASQ